MIQTFVQIIFTLVTLSCALFIIIMIAGLLFGEVLELIKYATWRIQHGRHSGRKTRR